MLGHNQPSIDSVVEENLLRGLLLSQLNCITRAVRDPRLESRHLQVLAQIIERTNGKSGMAYPGRARMAADIIYYAKGEPRHYSESTIATTTWELVKYGYLIAAKMAPEGRGRALAHYATVTPSLEDLQRQITEWCEKMRGQPRRKFPSVEKAPDVNTGVNVRTTPDVETDINVGPSDVDTGLNVRSSDVKTGVDVDAGINVRADVETGVGADVKTGVGQELVIEGTSRKTPLSPRQGKNGLGFVLDGQPVTLEQAFETFWATFPAGRKKGYGGTADLFSAIATGKHPKRRATIQMMVDGARRYAASQPNPQYVPLPKTWLNDGRWADDVASPTRVEDAQLQHQERLARLQDEQDSGEWRQ